METFTALGNLFRITEIPTSPAQRSGSVTPRFCRRRSKTCFFPFASGFAEGAGSHASLAPKLTR